MAEFKREKTHPACIWNPQKDKPIKFENDICTTYDEFEIEILIKAGYKEISKESKIVQVIETPEKTGKKKPGRPKKKG
ncbi:MAG: hypothetical protein U9N73_08505 [Candidatus Auribacterota bacterium]|nr:hypothetical protein [Candidatus Auribacterota bacterium]